MIQKSFFVDFSTLKGALNILSRNGFTNHIAKKQFVFTPFDNRDTTIPLKMFSQDEVDNFVNYIERDFLLQRGLYPLKFKEKERVGNSYFEIFENVGLHAETEHPIFVCGQFFPTQHLLKFTLVDLGIGFLPKIAEFTMSTTKITTAQQLLNGQLTEVQQNPMQRVVMV